MAILHLHRREILFLQRARVHVDGETVVYSQATKDGSSDAETLVRRFNIPTMNASCLILGQGTSLTQEAARRLQDGGVMVAFSGTGGTPFLLASQDYRPGRRLQKWAFLWSNHTWRLWASKNIQRSRLDAVESCWAEYAAEGFFNADPAAPIAKYRLAIEQAEDIQTLMLSEARFCKELYRVASGAVGLRWNGRQPGEGLDDMNRKLDHANYLAYGIASVALWAYGIPFSMPVTHGETRAGGLVFDVADAYKDAVLLPVCAVYAARGGEEAFRSQAVERLHGARVLGGKNGTLGFAFKLIDSLFPEMKQSLLLGFEEKLLIEHEKILQLTWDREPDMMEVI
jgi:CRISPR-associated protein Cas1